MKNNINLYIMEVNSNIVLLVLLLFVMLFQPIPLNNIYNTVLGRVSIIVLVVYFTANHTVLGLLAAIILISSLQISKEGYEDIEDYSTSFNLTGGDRTSFEDLLLKGKKSCKSHVDNSESIEPHPMGDDMYL